MTKLVLIVEDDRNQRQAISIALKKAGYDVEEAISGHMALDMLFGEGANRFDLVLLDMVIGDIGGSEVLAHIKRTLPRLPVIVLTGHSSIDNAVAAMRGGAVDFISKPIDLSRLRSSVSNALRTRDISGKLMKPNSQSVVRLSFDDLVGSSDAMKKAVDLARKGAGSNVPILLEGESGVGKEVFARAIQDESERKDKAFIVVNCGAIPKNLVESILFGHEKGAFTGAMEKHSGKFVEADGGTLFLDEVGELPLDIQVKLLRVLQEGEVDPVGGREPVTVDVRLISATNRNLARMVETGDFREDLFYRLNLFPIHLPPLRERKDDIGPLATYMIENICASEGYPEKDISLDSMELLKSCDWPGNVRQLENALFRAIILSDNREITPDDFSQISANISTVAGGIAGPENNAGKSPILFALDEGGDVRALQDVERDMIAYALQKYNGHMSDIARRLGVGRSTLYRKVAEYKLD
ncbi:Response regulatory protein [hydrothermal vent metagenome]|uniref:DNA-binding transcriptional regulator NtrC n=1 Tax=hydrothermal vent metagenome TaxID=652676 RepID=A0A3B0R7S1_9ZZZZ